MRARRDSRSLAILLGALLLGAGSGPLPARADGTPDVVSPLTVNGYASASWGLNFGHPDSRTNTLRVFDFDDNTFKLDVAELVVQRAPAKPRDGGFRLDLEMGSSVPRVSSSLGLFRTDSTAEDLDVQQAFVSWIAPVGTGLRFDAGKFTTPFGYEVIDGYDGWNDCATRSLLFGYAAPGTHTGLRAGYAFSPKVSGSALLVNGWDVARDVNTSKSVGGQVVITPDPALTLIAGGMTGAERTRNESDLRALLDAIAIVKLPHGVTLGLNADLGAEANAVGDSADASWSGVAGYARFDPGRGWALTLRGETFDDADGVRTGTAQKLSEFTVTPEVHLQPKLVLRADLRVDRSDHKVFPKHDGVSKAQPTIFVQILGSF